MVACWLAVGVAPVLRFVIPSSAASSMHSAPKCQCIPFALSFPRPHPHPPPNAQALLKKVKEVEAGSRQENIVSPAALAQAEGADVLCLQVSLWLRAGRQQGGRMAGWCLQMG